jgi:transposase
MEPSARLHVDIELHHRTCFHYAVDDQTGEICLDQAVPSERQALLDCLAPLRDRGELRLVYRVGLVRIQTKLRVRRRNVAQRYGATLAASDLDSAKARRLWQAWPLRGTHRLIVDQRLALLEEVGRRRQVVEERILAVARQDRRVELLDTLPGLDYFGALPVAVEIGDWTRFHSGPALACFAGLVPSEQSSGGRTQRGHITKEGSPYLRWIMVQAALPADKSPRLQRLQERVAKNRGPLRARVAVARELLVIAWPMLRDDKPYEERPPRERAGEQGSEPPVGPLTD